WEGVLNYYKENEAYLQGQLGNPKGEDQPNKKYYDPRVWLRAGQKVGALFMALPTVNIGDAAIGVVTLGTLIFWPRLGIRLPGHL
ncbi:hypothetical protein MJI12_26265, partial [Salmonella enterica subsp. enterica serovar Kentucky]|nr:hypothetical protein [Salmonella enterica subsp. enterica serovar Kentucky]